MKIGILLSGCGVFDGSEIQEAVFTVLALQEADLDYQFIGINKVQHHVINHFTSEVTEESRNMLHEAARIARGNIVDIQTVSASDYDGLVIPGGFGSAKNFTTWAFDGPASSILDEVKLLIVNFFNAGIPIVALCVSPVVIAMALADTDHKPELAIGTTAGKSSYDIASFQQGLQATGATTVDKDVTEIQIDYKNRIITAPCYMMEASPLEVRNNIQKSIIALKDLIISNRN